MAYIRSDQADIRVTIDGTPYFESWATYSGGDVTAADNKTRPGGMGRETSVGGPASRGDITVTIQWSDVVLAKYSQLEATTGNGQAKVSVNWLDRKRIAIPGAVFSRTGTVKSLSDPNADHNSGAVGMLTLVISADEMPA